jgi:hypothetical protein
MALLPHMHQTMQKHTDLIVLPLSAQPCTFIALSMMTDYTGTQASCLRPSWECSSFSQHGTSELISWAIDRVRKDLFVWNRQTRLEILAYLQELLPGCNEAMHFCIASNFLFAWNTPDLNMFPSRWTLRHSLHRLCNWAIRYILARWIEELRKVV